jgi:hypothetical protein
MITEESYYDDAAAYPRAAGMIRITPMHATVMIKLLKASALKRARISGEIGGGIPIIIVAYFTRHKN